MICESASLKLNLLAPMPPEQCLHRLLLLLFTASVRGGFNATFADGSSFDLTKYLSTPAVRAEFDHYCGTFEGWMSNGVPGVRCKQRLDSLAGVVDSGPLAEYGPDYAAVAMYIVGYSMGKVNRDILSVNQGQDIPVRFKVPILLTCSGLNRLAQNRSAQAVVPSLDVYAGSPTTNARPVAYPNGSTVLPQNVTWGSMEFMSTSITPLIGLAFTFTTWNPPQPRQPVELLLLRRSSTMADILNPAGLGIGGYDYPVNSPGGNLYQLEVTYPPGVRVHTFATQGGASWCVPGAGNPPGSMSRYEIVLEFAYIVRDGEPLKTAQEEGEMRLDMLRSLGTQLGWCWGAFETSGLPHCVCSAPTAGDNTHVVGDCMDRNHSMSCPGGLFDH